jgi:hypothetical protein
VSDGGYGDRSDCAAFHTLLDHSSISLTLTVVDRYVIGSAGRPASSTPSQSLDARRALPDSCHVLSVLDAVLAKPRRYEESSASP